MTTCQIHHKALVPAGCGDVGCFDCFLDLSAPQPPKGPVFVPGRDAHGHVSILVPAGKG
jgi:hypothetical protein